MLLVVLPFSAKLQTSLNLLCDVILLFSLFIDAAEATGRGGNYSVPEGSAKLFSCPVDGNPEPEVAWYKGTDVNGRVISNAKQLEATETGCYTCSASNLLGEKPVTITQCLTVGKIISLLYHYLLSKPFLR